mmetsp:Transcript_32706/g.50738  ORF Transcript_32706/g.50738 Transcript_32706/m.50738 type:complete len:353 (-) Transcript_32706:57-1115(-)|eukprot:CAMPEP_0117037594 /NCGR_PEP_ID=MMETSP0472-20121206/26515_1 /TAXON_ID=693140 ORGANISM="Tiarina fusus, Strain LIS" /NCGR_SAMPLE_ID=MMETSP0472 /ASSEMBLY_ACC=CAM_ASM_000603 /LENGTH=352 /DNA_ID=CAMNT_0004747601 /DNA_START=58 /DNA_END=1116 /DNA_ORIENTATION=-
MDSIHDGPVHFDQIFWEVSNTTGPEQQSFQSISEPVSMFHSSFDHHGFSSSRRLSCDGMFSEFNLQSLNPCNATHHDAEGKTSISGQHAMSAAAVLSCSSAPASDHVGFLQNAGFEQRRTITNSNLSATLTHQNNHGDGFNPVAAANASFAATFSDEQLNRLLDSSIQARRNSLLAMQASSTRVAPQSSANVIMTSERGGKWQQRFNELVEFKNEYEHCSVPTHWPQNHALAQWVKRQRSQYKLKKSGKHSNLSDAREKALDDLGFIWDSHRVFWEERLEELRAFRDEHGHANVPTKYPKNQQLAVWAKCQRRQFKLLVQGNPQSNMTKERIAKLASVGFIFDPRKSKQVRF